MGYSLYRNSSVTGLLHNMIMTPNKQRYLFLKKKMAKSSVDDRTRFLMDTVAIFSIINKFFETGGIC